MTLVTLVRHSERFDRPVKRVVRDAEAFRKVGDVVCRSEMSASNREDALRADAWSFCQSDRENGNDECIVEWSNAAISLHGMPFTRKLTDKVFTRTTGHKSAPVRALVVPLAVSQLPRKRRFIVISAHLSTDSTDARAEAWIDQCKGVVELVHDLRKMDPSALIVFDADFNKNFRDASERAMIEKHLCDPLNMKQAWAGHVPDHGGTHHNSLIDGWVVDKEIEVKKTWLLPDTDGSDHRPCATTLNIT